MHQLRRRLLGALAALTALDSRAVAPAPGASGTAPTPALTPLPVPEPLRQLRPAEGQGWLGVGASGRLWPLAQPDRSAALADAIDPQTPVVAALGRIVARRQDGRLWVGGGAPDAGLSEATVAAGAGLLVLPLAVIAVQGEGLTAQLVRLEPEAGGRWPVRARSASTVLPDAGPVQIDLDGRGDGGQLAVLAGPDDSRYRHAVLGDRIEATRVLLLERHSLQPLRSLALDAPHVLEDNTLRPWRGPDGPGLVSVRSGPQGAQLVLVQADPHHPDRLRLAALGQPIGTRHRWLSPSTDGERLLAVHMPHLVGELRLYQQDGDRLVSQVLGQGLSNHRIGSHILDDAAWLGHFIVLPDSGRRLLRAFDLRSGQALAPVTCPGQVRQLVADAQGQALACLDADGAVWRWAPG